MREVEQEGLGDADALNDRAVALLNAYERNGRVPDLQRAVELLRAALAAMPAHHGGRAACLCNLGAALRTLYERTRVDDLLSESVAVGRQALEAGGPQDPDRPVWLSNLAVALQTKYEATSQLAALDEEIVLLRAAVTLAPADHPYRGGFLSNLVTALRTRVMEGDTAAPELAEEAVELARKAVAALPTDDRVRAQVNLALALRARYLSTGNSVSLWEAADVGRTAIASVPAGNPGRPAVLSNTAATLRLLHTCTGNRTFVEEAIRYLREAIKATSASNMNRAAYLSNLGLALRDLWHGTGETVLLRDACLAMGEAADCAPAGSHQRGALLSNLTSLLLDLAERTGQTDPLEKAVEAGRAAVAHTPPDHSQRAGRLSNLASALSRLAKGGRDDVALLQEAVAVSRSAAASPADRTEHARHLTNLAAALQELAERTESVALLRDAVTAARAAVDTIASNHPFSAECQANLASALHALSDQTPDPESAAAAREAIACNEHVAQSRQSTPRLRIRACRAMALMRDREEDGHGALDAMEAAVELLPEAVARQLPRGDREYAAGLLVALPAQAAAAAVKAGRLARAVELLEHSRGIIVADMLDARSGELARLRRTDGASALADSFEELRRRIDLLDQGDDELPRPETDAVVRGDRSAAEARTADRLALQAQWCALLDRIRAIEGLEDFLRPPGIERLAPAAAGGHVVYVYADTTRCDALVLAAEPESRVTLVPLPEARPEEVLDRIDRLHRAVADARDPRVGYRANEAAEDEILAQLAWAWDAITGPILEALGHTAPPAEDSWPRVWWCPVGFTALLPLHAAGHHKGAADHRTVMDRVVSSYTPSARALADARDRAAADIRANKEHRADDDRTLIVAAPEVEGWGRLKGAEAEADVLARLIANTHRLADPTRETVRAALPGHRVAHFACHGEADLYNPAAGRLILRDHQTSPLTVASINGLRLADAALAYLSACNTTVTSPELTDEAVHLTAAFHLAGYRGVVGTLWQVSDVVAYDITESFYQGITADGSTPPDAAAAAAALNHAVRAAREHQRFRTPSLWAAHVHFGA